MLRTVLSVRAIEKQLIPRVYELVAEDDSKGLRLHFDLPLKLQELMRFSEGDKIEVIISDSELEDTLDTDLYMRGTVLTRNEAEKLEEVMISIGGLIFRLESIRGYKILSTIPSVGHEVYVRIRKLS